MVIPRVDIASFRARSQSWNDHKVFYFLPKHTHPSFSLASLCVGLTLLMGEWLPTPSRPNLAGVAEWISSFCPVAVGQFQVRSMSDLLGIHVQTSDQSMPPTGGVWGGTYLFPILILNGRKKHREEKVRNIHYRSCFFPMCHM